MATTSVYIGDTITVSASFYDDNETLTDPDGAAATFTAYYNSDREVFETGATNKTGVGVYEYDWLVPDEETTFILEMNADFAGNPQLKRVKVRAKFRP